MFAHVARAWNWKKYVFQASVAVKLSTEPKNDDTDGQKVKLESKRVSFNIGVEPDFDDEAEKKDLKIKKSDKKSQNNKDSISLDVKNGSA